MAEKFMQKSFADTYLYNKFPAYEKNITTFLLSATPIDKNSDGLADIKFDIKRRQISTALTKVFESDNVVLLIGPTPLPKAFKVICAKDVKGDKKKKIFIDVTGLIALKDGTYVCGSPDILIAYLVSAMMQWIYYADTKRILNNESLIDNGTRAYASLATNVVDYLFKISSSNGLRDKCLYLSSLFFLTNMIGKELDDRTEYLARSISGLSQREVELLNIAVKVEDFTNIKTFIDALARIFKISGLTTDLFIEKWMYLYSPGTVFGTELFVEFSEMLTDAYVGCYINNQKTIEKIVGQQLVSFTNSVLRIGSDAV